MVVVRYVLSYVISVLFLEFGIYVCRSPAYRVYFFMC